MAEELISIIVPVYNVEKYLSECLESILNQTYQNLEIILVDDGSTDNCKKICDDYGKKDKRIKVIHKENGGLSSARNTGLDVIKGDYVAFVDSDDKIAINYIESLYFLLKQNNVDIVECDFIKFENEIKLKEEESHIEKYTALEMQERLYSSEYVRTTVVWNKLYKKEIFEKLRFPYGKINEDEFIIYKAFDSVVGEILVTNEVLYFYRFNEASIMGRKFNVKRLDALQAFEERKKYYLNKEYLSLYKKTVKKYQEILKYYYLLTIKNIDGPEKYLKEIKKYLLDNYYEYIKLKEVSLREKFGMSFFVRFPNLYYRLANLKDRIKAR